MIKRNIHLLDNSVPSISIRDIKKYREQIIRPISSRIDNKSASIELIHTGINSMNNDGFCLTNKQINI